VGIELAVFSRRAMFSYTVDASVMKQNVNVSKLLTHDDLISLVRFSRRVHEDKPYSLLDIMW
jgi:hypothetical protein